MVRVMDAVTTTYIIVSTMRTGSYLLCEGLEYTGRAGHPMEVFCPERIEDYAGRWELPLHVSVEDYIRVAEGKGTTENGVFGMKIHGHHVEPMAERCGIKRDHWQVLWQFFPKAKYIYLTRRNRRAQAISWYRAEVTNEWWRIPGVEDLTLTGKAPEFDSAEIRRREIELERQDRAWASYLATLPKADVIAMDYETLAADYRGQVARTLVLIGEDAELARNLPEPRLMRQADEVSLDWERRMDLVFPR